MLIMLRIFREVSILIMFIIILIPLIIIVWRNLDKFEECGVEDIIDWKGYGVEETHA